MKLKLNTNLHLLFFISALILTATVSCSKKENTNEVNAKNTVEKSMFTKKSGGTLVCHIGSMKAPPCCPTPFLAEICGYEIRDSITNKVIEFNVTSVKQITGSCLQGCASIDIMKAARETIILYILDNESMATEENCYYAGTKNYIIRTPICAKQDSGYQKTKLTTCDLSAYCEYNMQATCTGGVLTVKKDSLTPAIRVGSYCGMENLDCESIPCF